ncbi:MAG: universal stress protein, partial [Jannaschia sp.]
MKTILAATDLSARSDRAVLRAAHLARDAKARLHIVHVVGEDLPAAILQTRVEEAEQVLADMVAANPMLAALTPKMVVEAGHVDRLLQDAVRASGADLVVVGAHRRRGMAGVLGKPTLARLLRAVEVPVLVAVDRPEHGYRSVSVGWDFSPAGSAAAAAAMDVAPEARVTLVHAWQDVMTG